jgi:carbonic anhydrase
VLEAKEPGHDNIEAVYKKILPAARKATETAGSKEEILNNAIRENILVQRRYLLRKSPLVNSMVESKAIKVVTGICRDDTGEVELFDAKKSRQW